MTRQATELPGASGRESAQLALDDRSLVPRVIFAMPVGPPYGGMTAYTEMLRRSQLFQSDQAELFDTTPPRGERDVLSRFFHSCRNTVRLLLLMRRHDAHIVHFMTSGFMGFYEKGAMALICQGFGAKCVLHPVGSFIDFYARAGLGKPVIRFMLQRVSAVATVHSTAQSEVRELAPRARVWLIPNPVDSHAFASSVLLKKNQKPVQILFCGALVQGKGVLDLIDAAARFKEELRDAKIIIVGDGALFGECERRIRSQELEAFMELRGFVDEATKKDLFARSHIFCLPSYAEGTPLSVLEAMAAGLPIVATTVGGIPFVVNQGREGWLVAPGDLDGLGRALVSLVDDEPARSAMGRRGLDRVERCFDIDIVADLLRRHLNDLAAGPTEEVQAFRQELR